MTIFGLVGSDNPALAAAFRDQLEHAGVTCEARHVVTLEHLVDRAGLDNPTLVIVDQPDDVNTTLRLLRELSLVSNCHVIAIGPASDPRRIIAVMQAGAHEYVDETLWQSALVESLVRLRTRNLSQRVAEQTSSAHVIGILSASGGVGGSTVAANVATVFAEKHKSALLVDMRLESGDLAPMLDLHPNFSLADLSTNLERLDDSLFQQILTTHSSGVQLLAAPLRFESISDISLKGFRRALAMGIRRFPYIVLDLGGIYSPLHQEAVQRADVLALLVRLDFPSVRNARRMLDQIQSLGIARDKVRVVVNRYGESKQLTLAHAQEALGCKLEILLPDEPGTVNWAMNNGQPIVTSKPRARIAKRLTELASTLNGRHP